MKSYIKYFLFTAIMLLFSCDKILVSVKCSDCTKDEPVTATLEISIIGNLTDNISNVEISIYSGNLEDDVLVTKFPATGTDMTYEVTVNKKYTLTATYHFPNRTYVVVDSVTPGVKYDTTQCTDPCYYVYNKKVNLKLKYLG
jgi:hypothetical protein